MEGIVLISMVCVHKFVRVEFSTKDSTSGSQGPRTVNQKSHLASQSPTLTLCTNHFDNM